MENLAGKTLLILGGTIQACDAVTAAHQMGIKVLVTDYDENSPAKQIADKSFLYSTTDIDAIVRLCREEAVDGIMTICNETVLPYYYAICNRAHLPCYINPEQISAFSKKDVFKKHCCECGLPVVPEYQVGENFLERLDEITFPILIKPSDNSASRGVSVCWHANEVEAALEKARKHSLSGGIIAEKYMNCEDVIINYTFIDGEYRLSLMGDRFVSNEYKGTGTVTSALIYPSVHLDEYLETTHPLICSMLQKMGIRDGVMFIQAFYEDGKFFCYDPGYRTCGAQVYKTVSAANGFFQMDMLIHHALTGSMGGVRLFEQNDPRLGGKVGCNMALLLRPGRIGYIEGIEKIKAHPAVINFTQFLNIGDEVTQVGTLKQTFARMHYLCDHRQQLKQAIRDVQALLVIRDESGENMLLPHFDSERIPM